MDGKLEQFSKAKFERVGHPIEAKAVCLRAESGDADTFKALVEKVKASSAAALILNSMDFQVLKAGLEVVADQRPLIGPATDDNYEAMAGLAEEFKVPLCVGSSRGLEGTAELAAKLAEMGVADLVVSPMLAGDGYASPKDVFRDLTFARRAALKAKNKDLGYGLVASPALMTDDEDLEMALAAAYICKYADIVILSNLDPARVYPLLTLVQNVYTDPQQPMQVEEGCYPIGGPAEDAPVLLTTNFSLTYFTVSSEIEASRVPTWLVVMDCEGLSVLTAWGAGKFVPDKIAKFLGRCDVKDKVGHRNLVIPGYVSQLSGEIEEETENEWSVQVGVREAADIPAFLKSLD